MADIFIQLNISQADYLRVYSGQAKTVSAQSLDGERVQFPASILRQFVGHNGIQGHFKISVDDQNKFVSIARIN